MIWVPWQIFYFKNIMWKMWLCPSGLQCVLITFAKPWVGRSLTFNFFRPGFLNPLLPTQSFCFLSIWCCLCSFCIYRTVWREQWEGRYKARCKVAVSMQIGRLSLLSVGYPAACRLLLGWDGSCNWLVVNLLLWYGYQIASKCPYAIGLSPAWHGPRRTFRRWSLLEGR